MRNHKLLMAMTLDTAVLICLILFALRKECSTGAFISELPLHCNPSPAPLYFLDMIDDFEVSLDSSNSLNLINSPQEPWSFQNLPGWCIRAHKTSASYFNFGNSSF